MSGGRSRLRLQKHTVCLLPSTGNSQYSQQQTGYQQGAAQQQAGYQQQYPNQQSYPGQQQGYGKGEAPSRTGPTHGHAAVHSVDA